jgi:hypothetical protein
LSADPTDPDEPVTTVTNLLDDDEPMPGKSRTELVAEVETLRAEVARLRDGEEPTAPYEPMTTSGHLLWVLGHAPAEMRTRLAERLVHAMRTASECGEHNHTGEAAHHRRIIDAYRTVFNRIREEVARLERTSGPEGRAVALAISFALMPLESRV